MFFKKFTTSVLGWGGGCTSKIFFENVFLVENFTPLRLSYFCMKMLRKPCVLSAEEGTHSEDKSSIIISTHQRCVT